MPSPARAAAFAAAARTILAVALAVLLAMAGGALAADAPAGKAEPEKAANASAAGSGDDEDEDDEDDEDEDDEDDYEGMPPGDGRDEVFAYCSACHSMKLVTQQGLTRADWAEVLVYMVEEHEMAEIEPEDEKLVLDYLARFYGRDRRARKMGR